MKPSHLIRFALLIGVLTFGGVTWFLRRTQDAPGMSAEGARTLLLIGRVAWGLAIAGCIVVFASLQREPGPARQQQLSIVAWALGESVAMLGGVVWFLTGSPSWYVPGLVFLVLTFLAFPGERR